MILTRKSLLLVSSGFAVLFFLPSCGDDLLSGKKEEKKAGIEVPAEPGGEENPLDDSTDDPTLPELEVPTYFGVAKEILDAHCVTCHSATPTNGAPAKIALSLYSDAGAFQGAFSLAERIKARISDGTMPPAGSAPELSPENAAAVIAWVDGGALKGSADQVTPAAEPVLTFIQPGPPGAAVADTIKIEVEIDNGSTDYKWSLFYSSDQAVVEGGTAVAESMEVSQLTLDWDTSALAQGRFYLYSKVFSADKTFTFSSVGHVDVVRVPFVTLTSHQGNQIFKNGTGAGAINWEMGNPGGISYFYKLEYSKDGGLTYIAIPGAENLDNVFTYVGWDITNLTDFPRGARYKVRVTAIDASGFEVHDVSNNESPATFGISNAPVTYFGDVYPLFKTVGGADCESCHGTGNVNANSFAMDNYSSLAISAFQKSSILSSDALLGTAGSMRVFAATFSDDDFDVVRLWKWDGAGEGVYNGTILTLMTHTGGVEDDGSPSASYNLGNQNIEWEASGIPLNSEIKVEYYLDGAGPFPIGTGISVPDTGTNQYTLAWNTLGFTVDHRYKIRVSAYEIATPATIHGFTESPAYFSLVDRKFLYTLDVLPDLVALGCGSCHSAASPSGGYDIENLSTLGARTKLALATEPGVGSMPSAGGLTLAQWGNIRLWDSTGRLDPQVTLSSHLGNELFIEGADGGPVTWTVSDGVGADAQFNYKVELINGASDLIADNLAVLTTPWTVPVPAASPDHRFKMKVTMFNAGSPTEIVSETESPAEFAISDRKYTYGGDVLPKLDTLNCSSCHPAGGYDIADVTSLSAPGQLAARTTPGTGTMPAANGLSQVDWKEIRIWDLGGNENPVAAITAPVFNTFFANGPAPINITWTAIDTAVFGAVTYSLDYRKKGGVYAEFDSGITMANQDWDTSNTTAYSEGYYQVRLRALNVAGKVISQNESALFYISKDNIPTYNGGVKDHLVDLGCAGCHGVAGGFTVATFSTLSTAQNLSDKTMPTTGNMPAVGGLPADDWKLIDVWNQAGGQEDPL